MTISWKEYFKNFSNIAALKSKDPSAQVGAVIVDENKRIISTGYNGFPEDCRDIYMSYDRPEKYGSIIHAEMNAILYAKQKLDNTIIYITDAPCDNCLKHIIVSKIKKVYYQSADIMQRRGTEEQFKTIRRLIKASDIIVENINGMSYIDELQMCFPFEQFHPHEKIYQRNELRENNEYIVVDCNGNQIIRIKIHTGLIYINSKTKTTEYDSNYTFLKI